VVGACKTVQVLVAQSHRPLASVSNSRQINKLWRQLHDTELFNILLIKSVTCSNNREETGFMLASIWNTHIFHNLG
jgi:hypothetical protein